jgi:uncharacterized SAM-binding protein YcdF (DUF218 family)
MVTSIPFFGLFVVGFVTERRRLLNGVPLLIGLFLFLVGLLFELIEVPAIDAVLGGGVVVAAGFLFFVLVLLPGFLIANGILMWRRERRRLGNLLSLLAGLGLLGFTPVVTLVGKGLLPRPVEVVIGASALVFCYLCLAFTCYLLYSIVYGRVPPRPGVGFVVVLGSRLVGSAVPPLLASRLDRARTAYVAEERHPVVITSGGQGADEDVPEARAMADYLISAGIPADRVLMEDRSTTTRQNLTYSKEIMRTHDPDYRCVLVTNNFHAFRTALLARRLGVNGQVLGSRTALYYLPSATIREFIGILRDNWKVNAIICALLVAAYVLTA